MKLILGSKSQGRQEVLRNAGFDFEILTADIDEKAIRLDDPEKLVLALANAKADAIVKMIDYPALLITADQVVVHNGVIREKPESEAETREFIRSYKDHPMEAVNGVVVTNTETGKRAEGIDISRVYFDEISEQAIDEAIEDGRVMHCAGAMRCEAEPLSRFVSKFDGSPDSTSGLPLKLLKKLIDQAK